MKTATKRLITCLIAVAPAGSIRAVSNDSPVTVAPSPTTTVAHTQINRVDVTDYGAKGDGSTDDTAAQQAAIAAAPSGGTVVWPRGKTGCFKTTATLNIIKPLTLHGHPGACVLLATAHINLFRVTSSNVTFTGLTMTGPQYATYHRGENAVDVTGTFHPRRHPTNIRNFRASNLKISGFGAAAIQLSYIDGFTVSNSTITNLPYAGIAALSAIHGTISGNMVSNITGIGSPGRNAYGIFAARLTDDLGNLRSQPNSANITISHNVIDGVPTWEGLDTHSGQNIALVRNIVNNTTYCISVGGSKNSTGTYAYGSSNATVSGNSCKSGVTDGSRQAGIVFTGAPSSHSTGTLVGNSITGHGSSTAMDGAIRVQYTTGVTVRGNSILYPSPIGIYGVGGNARLAITDNSIVDPWTNSTRIGQAQAIDIDGSNNSTMIDGNDWKHVDKVATYLLSTATGLGIRLVAGTANSATLGPNQNGATTYLSDAGGIVAAP